jgi:ribose transport system substrate-binding protein
MRKFFAIALAVTLVFSAMAVNAETILLSMKGPGAGNPFWALVEKGAREKAKELGVDLVVLAPPQESDITSQIAQIEDQMTKGVDGIALAPTDPDALAPIVDEALAEGTKVVFVDTNGKNKGVTFIGTNNEMGAKLAADYICKNVPKGSDVAILQGIIVQSTGRFRADGSHKGLTECGLNIVAEQPGDWDRAKGQAVMENILVGNPNIKAVFASNDNMALGAAEALKQAAVLDKVLLVGFDANPDAAVSILAGEMSASVAQNPYNMGALSVENLMKLIKGEKLAPVIDTGTVLVTKENAANYK